jgi:ABC-type multidrug transport system fused ATPase/permease subunit
MPSPEDCAGFASMYTFWWSYPTLKLAAKNKKLEKVDLPKLPASDNVDELYRRFVILWSKKKDANLLMLLVWSSQRKLFLYSFVHGVFFLACMFADPLILNPLLQSGSTDVEAGVPWKQLGLVALLSVSMLIRVTCMELCYFGSTRVMNNARSILVRAIFCESMHMDPNDVAWTSGKLTNLMATDADKLGKTSWTVWCIVAWSWAVVSSPLVVYFMYKLVGVSAFVGTATAIVGNFISVRLGRLTMPIVKRLQERRDQRAKLMEELIRSMRMVKLMQWQKFWKERIREQRELEMKELVRMRLLNAANSLVGALAALSVPVSIFAYYTLVEVSHPHPPHESTFGSKLCTM